MFKNSRMQEYANLNLRQLVKKQTSANYRIYAKYNTFTVTFATLMSKLFL